MRLTYDADADAAYVYMGAVLAAGEVARTVPSGLELDRALVAFDLDAEGRLVGMEILGASRVLRDETLETAERIG